MRFSKAKYFTLGCLTLASKAFALPSAEKYGDVATLSEGNTKPLVGEDGPLFFEDHDDPRILYAPYDDVFITPKEGEGREPQFGLTYDRKGGLLCFTLRAGYSKLRRQQIANYLANGYKVKPLAPMEGNWGLSLNARDGQSIFLAPPNEIKTVIPDAPVAMCSLLNKDAIRYVVASYQTGAGLGVNYNYTFRAVLTPMRIKASIDWTSFRSFVQRETLTTTQAKVVASGGYGPFNADAKAAYTAYSQVRHIVKTAIEKQIIKIWYRGEGGESANSQLDKRLLDEVTKVVLNQVFKPTNSDWSAIKPTEPKTECEANTSRGGSSFFGLRFGGSGASCMARASSYVYNSEVIFENRYYDYEITSEAIVNLPGAVASNFSYICRDYPKLFINLEDKDNPYGCPTYYPASMSDSNDTIKTEIAPNAPAAKMPEDQVTSLPPARVGVLPSNVPGAEDEEVVDMSRYTNI